MGLGNAPSAGDWPMGRELGSEWDALICAEVGDRHWRNIFCRAPFFVFALVSFFLLLLLFLFLEMYGVALL